MADTLSLLGDAASSRRQMDYTDKVNKQMMEYNDKMFNLTNERAAEAWNRENAYNHPKQQMTRLRQAGLNPHLVYGKGAETTAGSLKIGQTSNPSLSNAAGPGLRPSGNSLMEYAQIRNIQAQTDQTEAVTKNLAIDNAIKQLDVQGKTTSNKSSLVDYEVKSATKENVIRTAQENMFKAMGEASKAYGEGTFLHERPSDGGLTQYEKMALQKLENMRADGRLKSAILNNVNLQGEILKLDKKGLGGNDPYYIKSLIKLMKDEGYID